MDVYDNLRVKVSETGVITNLDELLKILKTMNITEEIEIFLINLQNRINNSNYTNKDILVNAIKERLLTYKANDNDINLNNLEALKLMQNSNDDLKKLSIISAKNNISNKTQDYLILTNESEDVEVVRFRDINTLRKYIKEHADKIVNCQAQEVFSHIKECFDNGLVFTNIKSSPKKEATTEEELKEKIINNQEYKEIRKYIDNYCITGPIEVAIADDGEKLYRVNDGLFIFTFKDGAKVLEVLKIPSIAPDRTDELNDNSHINDNTNEPIDISEERIDEIIELLQKRDIYGVSLSDSEIKDINMTIRYLIATMRIRAINPDSKADLLLSDYMESLLNKYQRIESGIKDKSLSEEEEIMCREYLNHQKYIVDNNLNNKNTKELANSNRDNYKSGIATVVMLLEIILLALFIILLTHLDI